MESRRSGRRGADEELVGLTTRLLETAAETPARSVFLKRTLGMLVEYSGCDVAVVCLDEDEPCLREAENQGDGVVRVRRSGIPGGKSTGGGASGCTAGLLNFFLERKSRIESAAIGRFSERGTFWTADARRLRAEFEDPGVTALSDDWKRIGAARSIAWVRLNEDDPSGGYLQFSRPRARFSARDVGFFESLSRVFSIALRHWRVTWSLQERVKELSCLYRIAGVLDTPDKSIGDILHEIVNIIPSAWLHDEDAVSRITLDDLLCASSGYLEGRQEQSADIVIEGQRRGCVCVAYLKAKPESDEGPFLAEERKLLDTIARELSLRIERRLYEDEQARVKEQLKHSNRLAVIGQLAAAVAHELNEPLTNILGFAQLAVKGPALPKQIGGDLERIIANSLHAREIVRKLLLYGRKMPERKSPIDVNKVAREALGLFEHRLDKENIVLELELSQDEARVLADPAHLRQVVANLVLNAMHAMPQGGTLRVGTLLKGAQVEIVVRDTGGGISETIKDKIFIPFFTTKDSHHGTGLGLTVVHEIVTGLGGTITIDSAPGFGTTVLVSLPGAVPDLRADGGKGNGR